MKRFVFLISAVILFTGLKANAQAPAAATAVNYTALEKKLAKSDNDIQNAKKNVKAATWTSRADVLIDIYNVHNNILYAGMSPQEAQLLLPNPKIETSQEKGDQIETMTYPRVTLKFRNGELESWTETNPIVKDPLVQAESAVKKAIELNTDGKATNAIAKTVANLKKANETEAVLEYGRGNMASSHEKFVKVLELNQFPGMDKNVIDTTIIYNAGRTAVENGNNAEAAKYFQQLDNINYDEPFIYIYLEQSLLAIGDTNAAVAAINKGFQKYPENQAIMNELINYYINSGNANGALELLTIAKQKDPENVSYVFAEGAMYEKTGDIETAEKLYLQSIDMNPDFYDAAYNLGVLYYNQAVKLYEQASKNTNNAEAQAIQTQGDEKLKKAIPYMERASEIDPQDVYSLQNLRNIYYRLNMTDKYEEVRKKLEGM
jgi:tetratricopeptide (TPR) repeat protein